MLEVNLSEAEDAPPPIEATMTEADEAEQEPVAADSDADAEKRARPRVARVPRGTGGNRETKAAGELRNNDDRAIKEWMEELSSSGAIRVKVERTSPKTWKGLNVGGNLARYDHPIDEDWVRDHHGGGDFLLTVQKPRTTGAGWVYAGARVLHIAGDPRTDDVYRDKATEATTTSAPTSAIVDKTFSVLERELANARSQSSQGGLDTHTIQAITAPMQAQVDHMATMLREAQRQLAQAQQTKPVVGDEFRDRMIDKLLDGDSARINALRGQYESELRQVKQSALDNEARLRDSFERDKQALFMSHEREMNAIRGAYDLKVASQEQTAATARALMDSEIRRLQADLSEAKAELVALRAKKDKTILEQASEFAAIKEAIGEITGDKEEEKKSTLEKVIEVAGNLPAVQGVIGKLAGEGGGVQQAQMPVPRAVAPQGRLLTGPDGNLYRQLPTGQVQLLRRRPAPAAVPGATPAPVGPVEPPLPEIAPATLKIAVDFLETAFRNGSAPDDVASSVRSMVPGDVIAAIRDLGIDGFLTKVAKISSDSPLATQGGRNWARKLGSALLAAT